MTARRHSFPFILMVILLLLNGFCSALNYDVQLRTRKQNWKPGRFYVNEVIDRTNGQSFGQAYPENGAKPANVMFRPDLATQVFNFLQTSLQNDTSHVPVRVIIEELKFRETGSVIRHTLLLNFKISIVRFENGKEYSLIQTGAEPSLNAIGTPPNTCEELLEGILEQTFIAFEEYTKTHAEQDILCKRIIPEFRYDSSYTNYTDGDTIRWTDQYRLKWSDFQANPDSTSVYAALSQCEFTYYAHMEYKDMEAHLILHIYPDFAKPGSWVKPGFTTAELLGHEQLHFDICELYIRKFKKQILSTHLRLVEPDEDIKPVFDETWKEYQQTQNLYDDETMHGTIQKEQQRWAEKVSMELASLSAYRTKNKGEE